MRQDHEIFAQIQWEMDEKGTLTIRGTGSMPDYSLKNHMPAPWQGCMDKIRTVCIEEGISTIGTHAFEECSGLTKVSLPASMKRIRAYAFKHCTSLKEIETAGEEEPVFRYTLDKTVQDCREEILFGLQAFLGVPWAADYFGDFYIRGEVFYISFASDSLLEIPEGISKVCMYAFQESPASTVILPSSLESIDAFAFDHSEIEYLRILGMNGSSLKIAPNAFIGSAMRYIEVPPRIKINIPFSLFKGTPLEEEIYRLWRVKNAGIRKNRYRRGSEQIPQEEELEIPNLYALGTTPLRTASAFRKLKYRFNRNPGNERKVGKVFLAKRECDFAGELRKRFSKGQILINVCWFQNRLLYVRSYMPDRNNDTLAEYTMYPCAYGQGKGRKIRIWSETLRYREKNYIEDLFPGKYPDTPDLASPFRETPAGVQEEWFVYTGSWYFGGKAELYFLKEWSKKHAKVSIDSEEENRIKDCFRWSAAESCG